MSRARDLELQRGLAGNPAYDVLLITLDAAVPLWMAELRKLAPSQRAEHVKAWAAAAADVVASHGDTLMFHTRPWKLREAQLAASSRRRAGDEVSTADTFNHLARGLAALAHMPGGVLFAGRHWCAKHWTGVEATTITDLTCDVDGIPDEPLEADIVTIVTTEVL